MTTTKSPRHAFHFDAPIGVHDLFTDLDTLFDLPRPTKYLEYVGDGEWLSDLSTGDALIMFLLVCESENISE